LGLVKRHVFRVKATQPLPPVWQRVQLFVYGVLSTMYRVFVGVMIILLVAFSIPGARRADGDRRPRDVAGDALVKTFKYLALDPELHRKRLRATACTLAFAALVFLCIGVIPWWQNVGAEGVIEPEEQAVLHAGVPGRVAEISALDGQWLKAGQVIVVLRDRGLEANIASAVAEKAKYEAVRAQALADNPAQANSAQIAINAAESKIRDLERQKSELTITTPIAGRLVAPQLSTMQGQYVKRGEEIATVMTFDRLLVKAAIQQRDVELVQQSSEPHTEIRLAGGIPKRLIGTSPRILPGAQGPTRERACRTNRRRRDPGGPARRAGQAPRHAAVRTARPPGQPQWRVLPRPARLRPHDRWPSAAAEAVDPSVPAIDRLEQHERMDLNVNVDC
jgi:multidrug resistance efflux pump